MINKLLEQRMELLSDLKHYIIMKDNDRSTRLQVAINDLDDIIKHYLSKDTLTEEEFWISKTT